MKVEGNSVLALPVYVAADGTAYFTSTGVPVRLLMDHLEKGFTIYEFLVAFPTVRRQQVIAFLELAAGHLVDSCYERPAA